MKYDKIHRGYFLNRPNRFIAEVEIGGTSTICHVKNTGRCKELLIPGAPLYLQYSDNPARKTKYDVIAVEKEGRMVNMDSQVPNLAVGEWMKKGNLFSKGAKIIPEQKYGTSRFDFYIEDGNIRAFLEVKGVTLEENGVARFPDAPTQRGVKHIMELCACRKEGYEAYILFLIQMKGICRLEPNWDTHAAFGEALIQAEKTGVHIMAYDCEVTADCILVDREVPVDLKRRKAKNA